MNKQVIIWEKPDDWTKLLKDLTKIKDDELPSIDELQIWSTEEICHPISQKVMQVLPDLYIQAYHACRTLDLGDYYINGIKIPDKDHYYRLLNVYYDKLKHKLTASEYSEIKKYVANTEAENGIFFCLDDKELVRYASHYLVYGCEKLFSAFVNALGYKAYNLLGDTIGIQTIFVMDIPIKLLNEPEKESLCISLIRNWGYHLEDLEIQHGLSIKSHKNIQPDCIIDHFHPKKGIDTHRGMFPIKFQFQKP